MPIRADYVGKNMQAPNGQRVYVRLSEIDGVDAVVIGDGQNEVEHPRSQRDEL